MLLMPKNVKVALATLGNGQSLEDFGDARLKAYTAVHSIEGKPGGNSEDELWRESLSLLREFLSGHEQNVGRDMNGKS